jgi:hypothetical protein
MRSVHIAVVLVALRWWAVAMRRLATRLRRPLHLPLDVAIVIPEAEGARVAAGTIVEVVYPGGESRGLHHFLQRWDGQTWSDVYVLAISDPDQPYDRELIENAWAPADEEFPLEDIAFDGSGGGQFTVIPAPTEPGTYRICEEQRALCSAAFEVTS